MARPARRPARFPAVAPLAWLVGVLLLVLVALLVALAGTRVASAADEPLPPPPPVVPHGNAGPLPLPPPPRPASTPSPIDAAAGEPTAESEHFRFRVAPGTPVDAAGLLAAYGGIAEGAYAELTALFGVAAPDKIAVHAYADQDAFVAATAALVPGALDEVGAAVDPDRGIVFLSLPVFVARTPLEVENAVRHATARVLLDAATGGNLPRGFAEGMAQYVERPVTPRLARMAATLDTVVARNGLLSWSDLNRDRPPSADTELIRAEGYAIAAFLVDRYGLRAFKDLLAGLRAEPDWRPAMRAAYSRDPGEIERQWRENVPRWASSEWKDNLVAAFDIGPARDRLIRADYAGAKALLEQAHRLFTDLGDAGRLAEVDALLRQCEVGIGAEASMLQAQEALERHTYDRAQTLVAQAEAQYTQLPESLRPDDLLAAYEERASAGLQAVTDLGEAERRARRWRDYPEARAAALSAGTSFAALGDEEMTNRARTLLNDLDDRQRRLVLMLGALAALTLAWLALWLWVRGPVDLDWG